MMASEKVDIRYAFKVLFLCIASVNLGNTFDFLWYGILFALFFFITQCFWGSYFNIVFFRPHMHRSFQQFITTTGNFWLFDKNNG